MSDDDDDLDPVLHRSSGRRVGIPNYNNCILIPIIEEILPNGSEAWRLVAAAYKEKSREANLRSEDDLKCNWVRKLCNNMKKPTGRSGDGQTDRINRCIEIQRRILDKTSSGILGASSEDDNRFAPSSSSSVSLSSSSSSSDDEEVIPPTEVQVPPLPPPPAAEDFDLTTGNESATNTESTAGVEATANVETTDVANSGVFTEGAAAAAEVAGFATGLEVKDANAASTHSRSCRVARQSSNCLQSSSFSTAPRPPTPQPRKASSSRSSKTGKTKNSTNRERGSVTKSIERIASSIEKGGGEDMRMMLEMRKMEWEEAEERRRQEPEEARCEREEMRQERMELEERRERRFEHQMQQHSEMMQTMMMFMMGGARGGFKQSGNNEDNSEKEGE